MIANKSNANVFYKIDPVNCDNFEKLYKSNIEFIKYGAPKFKPKANHTNPKTIGLNESRRSRRKLSTSSSIISISKSASLTNFDFKNSANSNKNENEKENKYKNNLNNFNLESYKKNRIINKTALNIESSLDDESFTLLIKNSRSNNKNIQTDVKKNKQNQKRTQRPIMQRLFTPTSIDQKLYTSTCYLNLKSRINLLVKKTSSTNSNSINNLKLPKLNISELTRSNTLNSKQEFYMTDSFRISEIKRTEPFDIKRMSLRNKYNINDLKNITKHIIGSNFSLNSDIDQTTENLDENETKEKINLLDKENLIEELPKPKLELMLNRINKRRENLDHNDLSKCETSESMKHNQKILLNNSSKIKKTLNPTAKLSQINDKVYLEIYMPTFI